MRNFTFLLVALLFSRVGYSQFPTAGTEGFESGNGPDLALPVAVSPWSLGTGVTGNQWAVFDNGVSGSPQRRWDQAPSNFHSGSHAAFINRKQNGGAGITSEDYLVTPKVTVPLNGQLTFWTRTGFNSTDDVNYVIKVNTILTAGSQTTAANYSHTAKTWNNATPMLSSYNVYELKTVDLSAYAGQDVYIAFVRIFNQPTGALGGNSWYIDDVKLVQRCMEPSAQTAANVTTTSANLSWTPNGSTSWEIEVVPVTGTLTGVGTVYNGILPYQVTGLTPSTCYVYRVRAKCTDSDSDWVGPYNFCTQQAGLNCAEPNIINGPLPYTTTDNTASYGDTYDTTQPTACIGNATNYMAGNDVFYSYTATFTGAISISMTPTGNNSSLFVYQGCSNVGVSCLAGVANATGGVRTITSLNVTAGQTYIIVLSSSSATQTYPYTLLIQQLNCPAPIITPVTDITASGATLNWTTPTSTSWQYVIQPLGSSVPTGTGITSTTTATLVDGLNSDTQYQFWVRADCGDGTFSPWSGPQPFTTLVGQPACGTIFTDPGGQLGNYSSNSNVTTTITTTPGNQVTVTFTSFNTQLNNDILTVYNGLDTNGTVLGTYSGTTLPPAITSSSPDGALTFVFTSNATTNAAGWIANVTCNPAPGCQKPILLTAPSLEIAYNQVGLSWTQNQNPDTTTPSTWQVLALPCTSPAPTDATLLTDGYTTTGPSTFTYPGLSPLTCYNFYVRAICSGTSVSSWSTMVTATTQVAPPICGGNFVDPGGPTANYPNNSNLAPTIITTTPGNQVTVTFTSFNTQLNNDILTVYNGQGTSGTVLGTYSGTTLPPVITSSSPDGALTFVFTSNATTNAAGWFANVTCNPAPACQNPILLTAPTANIDYNQVALSWIQNQNPDGSTPSQWQVLAVPCGNSAPTDTTPTDVGLTATTNTLFPYTGLSPLTCYNFYVRAICSGTSVSSWSNMASATTLVAPPICGGSFVDPGGVYANYPSNANVTTTITTTPGNQVTVTFTSFSTQLNNDLLKVYDGVNATTGTLLATYSGNTLPPAITSSSPDGALTFVFTSNATTNAAGWFANVTCNPAPACQKPILLTAPSATIEYNQVGLSWTQTQNPDGSTPSQWQVLAVPCTSAAPTDTTPTNVGFTTTSNPFTYTGLLPLTCYNFYVRAICSETSVSSWSNLASATTLVAPPICGGNFVDPGGVSANYPNNSNVTTTITTTPGNQVTVTFTSFNTQLNTDLLKVYDGIDATGTLLATYSGTTLPPTITSSAPSGALTFVFTSNGSTTAAGWLANVTCNPAPACQKPILVTTPATTVLAHSVEVNWSQTQNPDGSTPNQWQVIAVPCGSPAPTDTTPTDVGFTTPIIATPPFSYNYTGLTGDTCYNFYVRAICSSTSTSSWTGPVKATTPIACPKPTGIIANSTSISTATISWTPGGSETQWQMLCLPTGSPAPTSTSTGWQDATTYTGTTYTGLSVGVFYDVYVRAICSSPDISLWSGPTSLYIYPPLPSCAGVDLNLVTSSPGVINLCPNTCLDIAATYEQTHTTSSYTVSSTPYSPLFPFTGGTQVSVNIDDRWSGDITIPFKFCFYGNTYTSLNVGSNGVVTFNHHLSSDSCPWAYSTTIPNTAFPILNAIYAPYQDIDPGPNGASTPAPQPNINYQVLGTAPCRVMVISFSQVGLFSSTCAAFPSQTSQIVLYETSNVIDVYIKNRNSCTSWNSGNGLIGVQNSAGTNAVVPPGRNTGTWNATNEAWRFLPSGPSNVTFSWLQDGSPLTTNTNITVCPTVNTTLTAQAQYTACDGTVVTKSESVLLNIVPQVTPVFTQIGPLCQDSTAPILPLSSNDSPTAITGTWSPSTIDTTILGTTTYTFTPDSGQCALTTTMDITILPVVIPTFVTPSPICYETTAPVLPTSSSNTPVAITGTWYPPIVSNTDSATYIFTPDSGQCASTTTLNITVNTNCLFGSYASALWLTNCATSNFFNTVGSGSNVIGPVENIFPNTNLGTYVQNSSTLQIKGAEVKTYKSPTSNVCSARLNYRVYPQTGTPGAFQSLDLPFFDNCGSGTFSLSGGPCNAGDQKWQKVLPNTLYPTESPIDLTNYPPGNYVVQVYYDISGSSATTTGCDENVLIDNNGTYYSATFTIQETPAYASTNPTTCSGTDGTITISGLAPNTVYGLTYNHESTVVGPLSVTANATGNIVINGLNAATYSNFLLTVNSCSYPYLTPIVLVDPVIPTVTVNSPSVCVGSSATIIATTSTGTFSYDWTVPSGGNPGNVHSFTSTILGTYSVVITDILTGCSSASASGVLSNSQLIIPTFDVIAPICLGSTSPILPTVSTNTPLAVTGTWLPNVVSNTASGAYVFTPDEGQCSQPITVNVTVNSVPTPTANIITQPTCTIPTGTVEITSPVSSIGSVLPTDLFITEVTDSNSGSLSYIELYNGTGSTINLSNYSIKTANNGGSYTFTLPLDNVNLASGSTYVVALGNNTSNACPTPGGDASFATQTNGSGSVNFSVGGNDHFGLFNGTTLIDSWGTFGSDNWAPLFIGTEGADFRRKTTASPLPNPTFSNNDWDILDYVGNTPADCANNDYSNIGTYSLTTTTVNYQYNVDGGIYQSNPIFNGLVPGYHLFTVLDVATGCTNTVSVTLDQLVYSPSVTTFSYTTPVCANVSSTLVPDTSVTGFTPNGTYTVTSGNGLVLNPSTGVIDLANSVPGTYVINYAVLDNPVGCTLAGDTSFTLVINALPTVVVNNPKVCDGSLATVTATPNQSGTYSYAWIVPAGISPGDVASFTTSYPGVYSVIITDTTTGCSSASASGIVTINSLPTVTVNNPTVCEGSSAVVTATALPSGTYNYLWTAPSSGGNPGNVDHFTATTSGNYGVTITNTTTGCTSLEAISTVTINANPSVSVTGDTVCQGALATISASATPSGSYNYLWTVPSGNNPGNVASFTTAIAGTYSVIATNSTTGCSSQTSSGVATITPAFDFVITDGCVSNNFILEVVPTGSSFDVNSATVNWEYNGNPVSPSGTTFDVTAYLNSTTVAEELPLTFTAVVLSDNCQQTHSIVLDRIYCDIQKGISPNNDGKNDSFDLRLMNVQKLSIYNRYGTKVYSKSDYSNEWFGQSDAGNELPDGTYYYVIDFKNNQASKTGWIYINRESK